jgi:hypothetical protein
MKAGDYNVLICISKYKRLPESAPYPWRCLCRGSLQITRTTRFLRMILQLRQIFFTEASTFMFRSLIR